MHLDVRKATEMHYCYWSTTYNPKRTLFCAVISFHIQNVKKIINTCMNV